VIAVIATAVASADGIGDVGGGSGSGCGSGGGGVKGLPLGVAAMAPGSPEGSVVVLSKVEIRGAGPNSAEDG